MQLFSQFLRTRRDGHVFRGVQVESGPSRSAIHVAQFRGRVFFQRATHIRAVRLVEARILCGKLLGLVERRDVVLQDSPDEVIAKLLLRPVSKTVVVPRVVRPILDVLVVVGLRTGCDP